MTTTTPTDTVYAKRVNSQWVRLLDVLGMNARYVRCEGAELFTEDGRRIFMVSDLGASFGSTGLSWTQKMSKGNLDVYSRSRFIDKASTEYVDFHTPTRPALIRIFAVPEYRRRIQLEWIGKHIPRDHAKWMGQVLARLSDAQIRDAFRAAGYSQNEIAGFSKAVETRIADLNRL